MHQLVFVINDIPYEVPIYDLVPLIRGKGLCKLNTPLPSSAFAKALCTVRQSEIIAFLKTVLKLNLLLGKIDSFEI